MAAVGVFPGVGSIPRQAIRAPVNPLDKSTVISIFPRLIHETKPTIQPGIFMIEPGTYENPAMLVVGTSSWWKELDPDQPLLEVPTSSMQVADSIVRDYANGLFQCDMGDKMPGLFFIPGGLGMNPGDSLEDFDLEKGRKELREKHKVILDKAQAKQKNWFRALVEAADALWAQTDGNPRCVSDDMKLAAHDLNLKDKPWLRDFRTMQLEHCPACGELRDANFPICKHCQTIVNKEQYAKLGFQQVKKVG